MRERDGTLNIASELMRVSEIRRMYGPRTATRLHRHILEMRGVTRIGITNNVHIVASQHKDDDEDVEKVTNSKPSAKRPNRKRGTEESCPEEKNDT